MSSQSATRCPEFFACLKDNTPRNASLPDYEETPCFHQLHNSGSLKKVRKSIPRSRNKPERLTFPSVEDSQKLKQQNSFVSFDSAERPFSDISTRLATDVTVDQFKNASRCAFTPLPVEENKEDEEDELNQVEQHSSEKKKRDEEVAKIFAKSQKVRHEQNAHCLQQQLKPRVKSNSGRTSASNLKPKLLSKLESVLTYNAKMYRQRVQPKPQPVYSCFSACEERGPSHPVSQSLVDGSLNLGKPPKHPSHTSNCIPTPVNMSVSIAQKSLNLGHLSPRPLQFSNVSSVRRGSETSFQVNMSTSHLKPPHISSFSEASNLTSKSNLTCFAKTQVQRTNQKDLFVTSLFPRSHRYLEEKQQKISFDQASRSVSTNQSRLEKASSFLNSVRILGSQEFSSVKPTKSRSSQERKKECRSANTSQASLVRRKPKIGEATFVSKSKKAEGAPSLSSLQIQNKSFVFETTAKKQYGAFKKDLEKDYDPTSILNQLKNINQEEDFFLHKPYLGRGQAIRASMRDIRPSQKSSARTQSEQFNVQADRRVLSEIESVIEKRDHRRNASLKGEKISRSEREIREENKSRLCKNAQGKRYIFARQQGYKEGHIRSELSSQREREEIKKYIEERQKLRAQKDLLKWEASQESLPVVAGGIGDQENISPNFNRAIGLLKKKKKDRRTQLESSSSKKNRKSLGKLFPAMKLDKYKVEFGSEAKDALWQKSEQRFRETGVAEGRTKVSELMELCEDTLKRRLGKEFRKKSLEKELKYMRAF